MKADVPTHTLDIVVFSRDIAMPPLPTPRSLVSVRQRRWLVDEAVPPPHIGESPLVKLACIDDDNQGAELEVLWDHEPDAEVLDQEAWSRIGSRGFDQPNVFASYYRTMRWNCLTATDPKLFQAPFRSGIKLENYQLEPLRKALQLPRVNLFIADDVGLGKTIEAALIARELLIRKRVTSIVVACPPSVLPQWQAELENRFGLVFQVVDRHNFTAIRRERGWGVNPWTTHTRFLISHKLLIDETYTEPLREWMGDFLPGSLLILDEAHHAAPASGAKYAIDSKFTKAIRDIAPRFNHKLFLSATPHNGHSSSFSALLELLDPHRFTRGVPIPGRKYLDDVMVRRIKEDIRMECGGFPERRIVQIDIDNLSADAPELRLSVLLDQYRKERETELASQTKRKKTVLSLVISGLQQRLLSSIEAFAKTIKVHTNSLKKQSPDAFLNRKFDRLGEGVGSDDERAELSDEELAQEELDQFAAASSVAKGESGPTPKALMLLEEMTQIAEKARFQPDARVKKLLEWIRANMCPDMDTPEQRGKPEAKWNGTRVLIFTEYEDTLRYLRNTILAHIQETDQSLDRIATLQGATPKDRREEIKRAFNGDTEKYPLRILLATDAAREGINLQAVCHDLFHFDVPWNPSRLEQRNGRIDRKLQPSPYVNCHYFFYKQRSEDPVLSALIRKSKRIWEELGSMAQVLEDRLHTQMEGGIRHGFVEDLVSEIEGADIDSEQKATISEELDPDAEERRAEIRVQNDRLRGLIQNSREWIGLEMGQFREALSCSLQLLGAPPLSTNPDGSFHFPNLAQREGGDTTWSDTLDSLRSPRERDQKLWEWRKSSPIRPIVFEDSGSLDDKSVHLHLEHRVVQRLLGRFISQGLVHHDLSRACMGVMSEGKPKVVLLGRVSLFGPGAARLHEEIVPVTAEWREISLRQGKSLVPFASGRDAEKRILDLMDRTMSNPGPEVNDTVQKKLLGSISTDLEQLLPHLDTRAREVVEEAKKLLLDRGEREAKTLAEIIEKQKERILKKAKEDPQKEFNFEEKRQLDANRRHWAKRLEQLDKEQLTEPDRIRKTYSVQAVRIEPLGIAYLWSITG